MTSERFRESNVDECPHCGSGLITTCECCGHAYCAGCHRHIYKSDLRREKARKIRKTGKAKDFRKTTHVNLGLRRAG